MNKYFFLLYVFISCSSVNNINKNIDGLLKVPSILEYHKSDIKNIDKKCIIEFNCEVLDTTLELIFKRNIQKINCNHFSIDTKYKYTNIEMGEKIIVLSRDKKIFTDIFLSEDYSAIKISLTYNSDDFYFNENYKYYFHIQYYD